MAAPARLVAPGRPPAPAPRGGPARLPYPLPLTWLHVQRIERLERRVGARYQGWGWKNGTPFVDVAKVGAEPGDEAERFFGDTLYEALGKALDAHGGHCA